MPNDAGKKQTILRCEGFKGCLAPVTHIGSEGYVYCGACGAHRRSYHSERTRKMAVWERKLIAAGQVLPSYSRVSKRQAAAKSAVPAQQAPQHDVHEAPKEVPA